MRGLKITAVESRSLDPQFFEPPDNSKQKSFPFPESNIVILVAPSWLTPDFWK